MCRVYRTCKTCCFNDVCQSNKVCDNYATVSESVEEAEIYSNTEKERKLFYDEWLEYINKCSNFTRSGQ